MSKALGLLRRKPRVFVEYASFKVVQRLRLHVLRRTYGRVIAAPPPAGLVLSAIDIPCVSVLPPQLADAAAAIQAEADEILRGRLDVLGSGDQDAGTPPDWHTDFKSGYRWPLLFYTDVEVTRLDDDSDAKVPWEVSRSHHLLTLARAAVLYEDERYARAVVFQMEAWIEANPPGLGINWANPMEVGIRAINWIWCLKTLEARYPIDEKQRTRLTRALQIHGRHIRANLEGSPLLRSNHYLADVAALLVIGYALRDDQAALGWIRFARAALARESRIQIMDDGVGFEASLPYHGLALELFLVAAVAAEEADDPLPDDLRERLRLMAEVSRAVRHSSGRIPQFGDADSGRVLPAGFSREPTHDPQLWLATALVGAPRPTISDPDAEVAWTIGFPAWLAARALPPASTRPALSFPEGGLHVLQNEGVHVVVRSGDVGQNGNGGHAHNDLLSYEASLDGTVIVVDPGTYAYTSDVAARNDFRSTRYHNVSLVDGEELNPIPSSDVFRLPQVARASVEVVTEYRLIATHDAYRRLESPVHVTREIDVGSGTLTVIDSFTGPDRPHRIQSFVHLDPAVEISSVEGDRVHLNRDDKEFTLVIDGADAVEVTAGWVSPKFGERVQAPVVVVTCTATLPTRVAYEVCVSRSAVRPPRSATAARVR